MDPVKNAGVNDYTMSMPQQNEVQTMPEENYSSMPMVYDPTLEEKKESASSGIALKALGAIGLAGLALWGGHAWGSKGAKLAEEAKDAAVKAKDEAVKAKDEALAKAKKLQDANDATREILETKYTEGFWNKGKLRKESLEALGPKENEAKKVTEEVAEGAKKAEGEVKPEAKPETKADGAEKTEKKDGE